MSRRLTWRARRFRARAIDGAAPNAADNAADAPQTHALSCTSVVSSGVWGDTE